MDIFFHHGKEKRKSLSERIPSNKSSPRLGPSRPASVSRSTGPPKPGRLDIAFESPPLLFKGSAQQSSGALFSGQLRLTITEADVVGLKSLNMQLLARVTSKKPVHKDCPECQVKDTELYKWSMLSEPTKFVKGSHSFPFSYLLPGHLTATTHSQLGAVEYSLLATATTKEQDAITATHMVDVRRALIPPEIDRTSIRIFPPTNLKAEVTHPPLVHPIGEFNVQLRLTGLIMSDPRLLHRWRLRKMFWRVEERTRWISPACPKHAVKLGGEGKGILHDEIRHLGSQDLKKGWKSDFSAQGGGSVELEFPCSLGHSPVCDIDNPAGMNVEHLLKLELIVSEEIAPTNSTATSKSWNATGSARVLSMQFKIVVTERLGLGISWDEEQPPTYEDVPPSPPNYANMVDYSERLLSEDEDLDLRN